MRAASLSPVVGRSDCARCGRLTIIAYRLPTPLRPPIDTGAGDRGGASAKFSVVAENHPLCFPSQKPEFASVGSKVFHAIGKTMTPTRSPKSKSAQVRVRWLCCVRGGGGESVLFIGTKFSNFYTAVDTPAKGRVGSGGSRVCMAMWTYVDTETV